ncbi:MAG TPA: class I SAM-dependent methyltransferase [Puia sp.]|nr:class I SAM-dependent methyltransferase [Puia sp.]
MPECRICKNDKGIKDVYRVKEMMFGLDEYFEYFLCPVCNCLQIVAFPEDMGKYYGAAYYSHSPDKSLLKRLSTRMAEWRDKADLFNEHFLGRIIALFVPGREEIRFISYLGGIHKHSRILDVGSGMGFYLHRLEALGFTDLRGIDPFLKEEIVHSGKVTIQRKYLADYEEKDFDLITLQHTFEHLPNPQETLKMVYDRLVPGGYCVIRVPVIPNMAWEEYRENWFQIDAPRHIFIPSVDTMERLCGPVGFRMDGIVYDSTPKQFYISEQYRQGIPLIKQKNAISPEKMAEYRRKTFVANKTGKGDQAIFILRK